MAETTAPSGTSDRPRTGQESSTLGLADDMEEM